MNVKIGKQIKILRNRDGVTQDRLAEALGVTSQAISKWERNEGYPDITLLPAIASYYNVSVDDLLSDNELKSKSI